MKTTGFYSRIHSCSFCGHPAQQGQKHVEAPCVCICAACVSLCAKVLSKELARVGQNEKFWDCEMRIPMAPLGALPAAAGTRWRINLYRGDAASKKDLARNPCLVETFHAPERFGVLKFTE